jgi:hypothetical protein
MHPLEEQVGLPLRARLLLLRQAQQQRVVPVVRVRLRMREDWLDKTTLQVLLMGRWHHRMQQVQLPQQVQREKMEPQVVQEEVRGLLLVVRGVRVVQLETAVQVVLRMQVE